MSPPELPPIQALNGLAREEFVAALKPLFEGGGVLGGMLFGARPFASWEKLIEKAEQLCESMGESQRIEVINSHPPLGADAAALKRRSLRSFQEQGYDVAADAEQEAARDFLRDLSSEYQSRFGFRFVVFVDRRPPSELLPILRERMTRSKNEELATAVRSVFEIATDRLRRMEC